MDIHIINFKAEVEKDKFYYDFDYEFSFLISASQYYNLSKAKDDIDFDSIDLYIKSKNNTYGLALNTYIGLKKILSSEEAHAGLDYGDHYLCFDNYKVCEQPNFELEKNEYLKIEGFDYFLPYFDSHGIFSGIKDYNSDDHHIFQISPMYEIDFFKNKINNSQKKQ